MRNSAFITTIAAALTAFVASSHAATMDLTADKASYQVGETIHLAVTTDAQGELFDDVFAQLLWGSSGAPDGSLASYVPGSWVQTVPSGWIGNSDETVYQRDGAQTVLNMVNLGQVPPGTQIGATLDLVADAVGVLELSLGSHPETPVPLHFGSVVVPPELTVTIVPEPTTALLLGLGLLALGARRRRREG